MPLPVMDDEPGQDDTGVDILGILGQDFLARHSYTIDYRHRQLRWYGEGSLDAGAEGVGLALHPSEGRYLLELPQDRNGGHLVRLVPDSGTETLVVFERNGRLAVPVHSREPRAELRGLSGRRPVDVATFFFGSEYFQIAVGQSPARAGFSILTVFYPFFITSRIGGVMLRDQVAAIVGRPGDGALPSDGLLPLHLFASVSFDSRGLQLVVRPW